MPAMPGFGWRGDAFRAIVQVHLPDLIAMIDLAQPATRARIAPAGLMFLAITSVGWGLNWPVMKYLLTEWPPMSARGLTGVVGAVLLAALALAKGQSLRVPQGQWPRLLLLSFLNVTFWMTLMGLALLWLPASEASVIAYTMPICGGIDSAGVSTRID